MTTATDTHISSETNTKQRSTGVRAIAHIVSYIFHPLFIPVYITSLMLFVHPLVFAGYDTTQKLRLLSTVLVNLTFLPAVTVFLCWRLRFISNMYLETQKDRIIPLAAAMIFYFWCWFVLKNFTEIPLIFREFLLGSFITIIVAWLANISFKISLHALAMGGMVFYIFLLVYTVDGGSAWYLAAAVLITGAVCTARLVLSTHRPFEIYSGLIFGILCQVMAAVV